MRTVQHTIYQIVIIKQEGVQIRMLILDILNLFICPQMQHLACPLHTVLAVTTAEQVAAGEVSYLIAVRLTLLLARRFAL